jgi:hypothetical protein
LDLERQLRRSALGEFEWPKVGEFEVAIRERISELHYSLKTIAYTMINLRHFCQP